MLIGNIARDPELRYTTSGTAVCSFRIATNRSWVPSDGGDRKEETEFHRIVTWNKLAELCAQLITKGRKVYIEGRLQTRQWETPEGERRSISEIIAEDMVLLDSRKTAEREEGKGDKTTAEKPEKVEETVAKSKESAKPETKKETGKDEKGEAEEEKGKKTKEEKEEKEKDADEGDIDIDDIPF